MSQNLHLLFTGDVCFMHQPDIDDSNAASILAELLPFFEDADLRIMNLETPLSEDRSTPIVKSGPNIIGHPKNAALLRAAHCDCVSLSNNHTGDFGDRPLFDTMELLDAMHIAYAGAGRNIEEAYRAWRTEKNGIRISLLCVNENEFGVAETDRAGSAGFSWQRLSDKLREEHMVSDFVLVFFHGGNEHNPLPSPMCRERYRMIIRLGADALIGGHTHCVQGWEIYDGKPIIYSMGNFLFHEDGGNVSWRTGYMTSLSLVKGENPTFTVLPYLASKDGRALHQLTGERLDAMMHYLEKLSALLLDDAYMQRHYMGWCTISGIPYIRSLVAKPEYFDPDNPPENIAPLRNLLSCEAHNELIRTTLNLVHFKKLKEAFSYAPEVRALQKLPLPDNI